MTAVSQAAVVGAAGAGAPVQMPCPNGGSITMTFTAAPPPVGGGSFVSSSRIEFDNCQSLGVVMQGDPYIETSGEFTVPPAGNGQITNATTTMRTSGGVRFTMNGVQGRAQFACTQVMTIQFGTGGTPQISIVSSGTISWEQPLGTVPVVRPCGMSTP